MLKSRLADAAPQAAQLPRGCRLLWAAAPGLTIGWLLLLVARGLLPVASVYLTRPLVNRLLRAIDAKGSWETVQPVLILVALVALVMVAGEILAAVGRWIRTVQSETVQDYVSGLIHTRSVTLDLAFFESAEFFDRLHRARAEAGSRSIALLENGGQLLQNGITLLAMGAVLIPFGLWLPAALVLSTAPALYVVVRTNLDQHRWWLRTTPDTRRADYFDWVLTAPEFAAEIRLFGLGDYFQVAYQKLRRQLRDERMALVRSQSLAELGAGALGFIVFGLAVAAMVWRAVLGQITLGDLALFYQAFDQGQRLLRSLLESLGQAYANSLFLGGLFEFLDLEPRLAAPADPTPTPATVAREVRFRRVSFRYPRSRRPVLRELELSVRAGQVAAIVGPNGTGKSTLTKLLCRLYDPDEGSVELDGTDLRQLPIDELRRMISVVFQVPAHYNATAADNVALGDRPAAPDRARVQAAAEAAGADEFLALLPAGYDTLLGSSFVGGTDLSVGEWQRVALARALVRPAPILILDEPTSAMDSWAEAELLRRLRDVVKGRTVLIITHRFTTAMHADIIHVLEGGQVVESGSHAELLARGGRYAQSWLSQARETALLGVPNTPRKST